MGKKKVAPQTPVNEPIVRAAQASTSRAMPTFRSDDSDQDPEPEIAQPNLRDSSAKVNAQWGDYVEIKRKDRLQKLAVREFNEKNYSSFMAFVNCLVQYLRHHDYSDEELITIIQGKLPQKYFQLSQNLIHDIEERGVHLSSDLFISELNTLISGKGNSAINYNLRLNQSDIEHFDFCEFASRKFFALKQKKKYLTLKQKLSDIALTALPQISDKLLEMIDNDEIMTLTELIVTGEKLTGKIRLSSYLPDHSDSDVKHQNARTHPFNQNNYYNAKYPNPNKSVFPRQNSFGKSGETRVLPRPQGQSQQNYSNNYNHNYSNNYHSNQGPPPANSNRYSPGPERKVISPREIGNPFRSDDHRQMVNSAREIDEFISKERWMAEQQAQAPNTQRPPPTNQADYHQQAGRYGNQSQPSFDYLQNRGQNYSINGDDGWIEVDGEWIPIGHRRPPYYREPPEEFHLRTYNAELASQSDDYYSSRYNEFHPDQYEEIQFDRWDGNPANRSDEFDSNNFERNYSNRLPEFQPGPEEFQPRLNSNFHSNQFEPMPPRNVAPEIRYSVKDKMPEPPKSLPRCHSPPTPYPGHSDESEADEVAQKIHQDYIRQCKKKIIRETKMESPHLDSQTLAIVSEMKAKDSLHCLATQVDGYKTSKPLRFYRLKLNGITLRAIFDSCATTSFLTKDAAKRCKLTPKYYSDLKLKGMSFKGVCSEQVTDDNDTFYIGELELPIAKNRTLVKKGIFHPAKQLSGSKDLDMILGLNLELPVITDHETSEVHYNSAHKLQKSSFEVMDDNHQNGHFLKQGFVKAKSTFVIVPEEIHPFHSKDTPIESPLKSDEKAALETFHSLRNTFVITKEPITKIDTLEVSNETVHRVGRENPAETFSRIQPLKHSKDADLDVDENSNLEVEFNCVDNNFMISPEDPDLLESHYQPIVRESNNTNQQIFRHKTTVRARTQRQLVDKLSQFIDSIELSPNRLGDEVQVTFEYEIALSSCRVDSMPLQLKPPDIPIKTSSLNLGYFTTQTKDSVRPSNVHYLNEQIGNHLSSTLDNSIVLRLNTIPTVSNSSLGKDILLIDGNQFNDPIPINALEYSSLTNRPASQSLNPRFRNRIDAFPRDSINSLYQINSSTQSGLNHITKRTANKQIKNAARQANARLLSDLENLANLLQPKCIPSMLSCIYEDQSEATSQSTSAQ